MEIVKVVQINHKLKVVPGDSRKSGFVRFPRKLRKSGKLFMVDELQKSAGHWIVKGQIQEITVKKTGRKKVKQNWYIVVEYDGLPDFAGKLDNQIIKAAKKYKFKESGSGFGGVRDISFTFRGEDQEITKSIKSFAKDLKKMTHKPEVVSFEPYNLND